MRIKKLYPNVLAQYGHGFVFLEARPHYWVINFMDFYGLNFRSHYLWYQFYPLYFHSIFFPLYLPLSHSNYFLFYHFPYFPLSHPLSFPLYRPPYSPSFPRYHPPFNPLSFLFYHILDSPPDHLQYLPFWIYFLLTDLFCFPNLYY